MFDNIAINVLARYAATKEWPKEQMDPDEIVDVLLDRRVDFEKINNVHIQMKKTSDERFVNVITCRKIEKTNKKLGKFYFDDKYKICCPKDNEKVWNAVIEKYSNMDSDDSSSEFSDNFDWASDESDERSDPQYWDYIIPEMKITKNKIKNIFF